MNLHPDYLLNEVNEPSDIKDMSLDELKQLATEMRQLVLERDAKIGGHVGPNLGVMELTIAFHYVFDSPHDKVIWDVSHQSYAHKMLTGRKLGFLDPDHYEDITGFTSPEESAHDFFATNVPMNCFIDDQDSSEQMLALASQMGQAMDDTEREEVFAELQDYYLNECLYTYPLVQQKTYTLVNSDLKNLTKCGQLYWNIKDAYFE